MRDNQQRLENIRRERTQAQQDLERLRAQVHNLADELSNLERQRETTNRIVNELDRQIVQLSGGIDHITVDLILAQDALEEKRAVLERRLVDIYKRGALYTYQVLLAAESFGDLLSRYKYLYLVSRQDRQLTNEMNRLRDRIAQERRGLVGARDALERRRGERSEELQHFMDLARRRETSLRETRRHVARVQERLTAADAEERRVSDAIAALERARRAAEARESCPERAPSRTTTSARSIGRWTAGSCTSLAPRPAPTTPASPGTGSALPRPKAPRCRRSRRGRWRWWDHSAPTSRPSSSTTAAAFTPCTPP
jgi:septal ring factor EnvC (AmiA/AmiB activator)